jgi:membrane-bound lytic murein transglycosylase D
MGTFGILCWLRLKPFCEKCPYDKMPLLFCTITEGVVTGMRMSFPRLLLTVVALASPVFAETSAVFPSQGLEDRIEFWKKVYTQYGQDDVIIHDRIRVNLIYDIAARGEQDSKITAIQQALDEIRSNLDTPENLSPAAAQVKDAIVAHDVPLTAASLADLRSNVHTQIGIKERFREGVIRSGRYLEAFQQIFEKQGIPTEVSLLPLVESSFENRALSTAGAAGIWQFTRSTGKLYLTVSRKVDERLDPTKAANAAARLLHDNYGALGSWPLAITAYNHGRGGMLRAQEEVGSSEITKVIDEYKGPLFGYASMNFYSEFLAAIEVYNNYQQYFGQLVLDQPSMKPTAPVTLAAAKTPTKPVAKKVLTAKASPSDKYRVRKGDTLAEIAQKFGTTVRELMDSNNLRNSVIHAGQVLLVR